MTDRIMLEKLASFAALWLSCLTAFGVGLLLARSSGFASGPGIWGTGMAAVTALMLAAVCSREAYAPESGRWPGWSNPDPAFWRGWAYGFLALAAILGIMLQYGWQTGLYSIPLGGLGVLLSYFYFAPPLEWHRRPAGELAAGLSFGLLPVVTGFYLQGGHPVSEILFYGLPLTFSAFNLFLVRGFPSPGTELSPRAAGWWAERRPVAAGLTFTLINVLTIVSLLCCIFFPAYPLATRNWLWLPILLAVVNQEIMKRRGYLREESIRRAARLALALHTGLSVIFALGLWWRL